MHRPPSVLTLARESYGDDGSRWVVAQAEAEIVTRYGELEPWAWARLSQRLRAIRARRSRLQPAIEAA